MPIRIYAFAKQLKIDSKVLVSICEKVGISGKGSALASLSDDEVAKIKGHMDAATATKSAVAKTSRPKGAPVSAGSTGAFRREDYIAPAGAAGGKIRVLKDEPKQPQTEANPAIKMPAEAPVAPPALEPSPVTPAPPVPAASPAPVPPPALEPSPVPPPAAPPSIVSPVTTPPMATPESDPASPPQRSTTQPPVSPAAGPATPASKLTPTTQGPPKRVAPGRPSTTPEFEMPVFKKPPLERLLPKKGGAKKPPGKPPVRTAPAIKLAPMPAATVPVKPSKKREVAAQKPDLRLPLDAIRASKAGAKPLSDHLRRHEEQRRSDETNKSHAGRAGAGAGRPAASGQKTVDENASSDARRGVRRGGKPGEAQGLGGREARQLKRKRSGGSRRRREDSGYPRWRTRMRRTGANTAAPRKENVVVVLPCTVRSFSESIGIPVAKILGKLMGLGTVSSITAGIDPEMAELLAEEFGVAVDFRQEVGLEDKLLSNLDVADDPSTLKPRPPIVTFLGHVDHGKTSLLDRIINIDVVSGEKGGITQHIRAYRVERETGAVAFVDTPGHEAFTEMRARGASVTDIAVLVVAADDGIMPQTEEAISHARAAGVPIVVALNKIDLPGINTQRIYEQLAANDLLPSEWGGDVELVKTSATTGEGIEELMDTLTTVADLHEYVANPERPGAGTCIEAQLHEGRGVVAKLLVQKGTMRVGDVVVCGTTYGRVKAMYNTLDATKQYQEAGPSTPVDVTGLNATPDAGDKFYVLDDVTEARELAEQRAEESRQKILGSSTVGHVTLEDLFERLNEAEIGMLNIILRADVRGSIAAIRKELTKLEHPEVQIKILQATVGGITEADVHLADASDAIIIGFGVVPDEGARILAEKRNVQIRRYDIIYQITEDLKAALEGLLKPEERERFLGRALVQQTFQISRFGTIAGCRVLSGTILRDCRVRVIRENRIIGDYKLDSLRRNKDDVREVREGFECGMKLVGFNDLKEGDILEAYKVEEVARTF